MTVRDLLLVGLGGGLGSMLRYIAGFTIGHKSFPLATLLINIAGSFIIGIVVALSLKNDNFNNNWRPFLAAGLCGGFTTFSAFSVENVALLQNGKYSIALGYILLSVTAGIIAAWLGFKLINN